MIIKNALVYSSSGFEKRTLYIKDGRFVNESAIGSDDAVIDADGMYAIPGLIDIHFHGAVGKDFCDASEESISKIAEFEGKNGVLAICPATMTLSEEQLMSIMKAAKEHTNTSGADLVGINMEGPYISMSKVGAQNPAYVMTANEGMFDRLMEASGGLIKLVDIAPEVPGNIDFIEKYADKVRISLAHMVSGYDDAKKAFQKGAKHLTHLYNAMPGITHREPGPIIAALEEGATVELISDGIHVHPAMIRFTFKTFGSDKVILISDSLESTGLPDGDYMLGGQKVTVCGKRAVLTEKPDTIAGGSICLFENMQYAINEAGIEPIDAIRAASENPAKAIGIDADYGTLEEGRYGNVLLCDEHFELKQVIKKGVIL